LDSTERIAVPLLIVQTISVVFLWSLDTLAQVSQNIFTLFLSADLLSFGLMAHVWLSGKTGAPVKTTTLLIWGLVIMMFFVAGFIFS
jgi:hypothetical protein